MRITVVIHDTSEAPRSFTLAGRSHEELDDLHGEVTGWLGFLFHEAHGELENTSAAETAAILSDSEVMAAIAEAEAEFDKVRSYWGTR